VACRIRRFANGKGGHVKVSDIHEWDVGHFLQIRRIYRRISVFIFSTISPSQVFPSTAFTLYIYFIAVRPKVPIQSLPHRCATTYILSTIDLPAQFRSFYNQHVYHHRLQGCSPPPRSYPPHTLPLAPSSSQGLAAQMQTVLLVAVVFNSGPLCWSSHSTDARWRMWPRGCSTKTI